MDTAKKRLPIGIENFREIRTDEYYYVDKTLMIRDLLLRRGKVNLFTRPRRFGKSLNMSMLQHFFEIGGDRGIFEELAIAECAEICRKYMGKYPVISVSLKGINGADYSTARALMCSVLGNEAMRFQFLLDDERLTDREKEQYSQLVCMDREGQAVFSVTDEDCDAYFGFTDDEILEMLSYYGLEDKYDLIREWYDGYHFGAADVYCPWDVINYISKLLVNRNRPPQDYWSNTSSNDVVRHFIEKTGSGVTKSEIEMLVAGETVSKEIYEDLTYNRLYDSVEHIWSVLFMTGYLTQRGTQDGRIYQLTIPNMEIRNIFKNQIMAMFRETVGEDGGMLRAFCGALERGGAK